MEELDMLLEELASNATKSDSDKKLTLNISSAQQDVILISNTVVQTSGIGVTSGQSAGKNVYSQLPSPVSAEVMSPGTATRELDSIMNELLGLNLEVSDKPALSEKSEKDTKPEERKEATGNSVQNDPATENMSKNLSENIDTIDNLLGTLNSDMEKMGVRTTAKGHCASCGKCIAGKMITALGQVWHPEHFVCVVCKEELGSKGFFERDGNPYCDADYQNLYAPRCAYCQGPILQNILTAMDRTWHPEHFFCNHCGERFGPEGFMEREGKPYCPKDFYFLFAPKCSGCGEPVRENYLSAANGTWHPDCFVCADCLKPFTDGCFLEMDGRPLCSQHYHSRMGTLCATCNAPITGRCISALGRRFHPEHFVCAFCLRQLSQGVFKEQAGKPYCNACHTKLFL
ncbi:leupaxin isoform X1 [Ictalurus furcatus]|uniref:leupaxin isoform X1 n=1 Tax=Ictalurus furcatus TaxID=66913 RepID=UPI00234FDDD1|nr:leupaxin isoform X1 [Ictalurus furcatus]